jgi:hypothetical protein
MYNCTTKHQALVKQTQAIRTGARYCLDRVASLGRVLSIRASVGLTDPI